MTTSEMIYSVILPTLLTAFGGSGLLTWYLQERFKNRLKREAVEHEAAIRHEYEARIENLRSQFTQQNFRFSKVFETTEVTIAKLYGLLLPVLDSAEDYTVLMQSRSSKEKLEKLSEFSQRCNTFYDAFRPNRIYVPKTTADQILELMGNTVKLVQRFNMSEQLAKMQPLSNEGQASLERIEKQMETLKDSVSPLLRALEMDFQRILGFPESRPETGRTFGT